MARDLLLSVVLLIDSLLLGQVGVALRSSASLESRVMRGIVLSLDYLRRLVGRVRRLGLGLVPSSGASPHASCM